MQIRELTDSEILECSGGNELLPVPVDEAAEIVKLLIEVPAQICGGLQPGVLRGICLAGLGLFALGATVESVRCTVCAATYILENYP